MTTLGDLRTEIYQSIGGRSDTIAQTAALRGVNSGILVATLIHEPPEVKSSDDITATSAGITTLTSLTRFLRIDEVYNTSRSKKVYRLAFTRLQSVYIYSGTDPDVEYYSTHGSNFHYRPTPSSNQTLKVYFLQYPTRLTADENNLPFESHQDFILSFATMYAMGTLEEKESSDLWGSIAEKLSISDKVLSTARRILTGEVDYDYIQQSLPTSTS